MKRFFQNIVLWVYIKIHSLLINIGMALYETEINILKANPSDLDERNNHTQRMRSRNRLLEKFYAGQRDERYVQDYYALLKKSDKFMKTSTSHKMAVAADKYGTSYGMKDQYGRRFEHYGFFDEKHKNVGKTLGEVLAQEFEDRRTKDDDYEILYIFNNKPIEVGLVNIMDVVEKTQKDDADFEYEVLDMFRKSKQFDFPIKAYREDENVVNKIEQLTEYLHAGNTRTYLRSMFS